MKKHILITLVLFFSILTVAAQKRKNKQKIKALKIAYLTQELNLNTVVAQKFWSIYDKHEGNLDAIRRKRMIDIKKKLKNVGDFDAITEEEAKLFVKSKIDLDRKELAENEKFLANVSKVLSYKQIFKLHLAKRKFARKLMRKYRIKQKLE